MNLAKKNLQNLKLFQEFGKISKNSILFKTATYTPKTATYTPKTATYTPKTATYRPKTATYLSYKEKIEIPKKHKFLLYFSNRF